MSAEKRPNDEAVEEKLQETQDGDDDDGWIGPMPSEAAAPKAKKRKGNLFTPIMI